MSTKKSPVSDKKYPKNGVGKEGTTTRTLKEYDLLQQISQEHKTTHIHIQNNSRPQKCHLVHTQE